MILRRLEEIDANKEVKLPEGLTEIPDSAFYFCISLENINIPSSVTAIGEDAFLDCFSLKSLVIPESTNKQPRVKRVVVY